MNPRPYTLRRLKWMADGKREHSYDVAIAQTLYIRTIWNGQRFDPFHANPYSPGVVIEDTRSDEQKKVDTKEAMGELKAGLSWLVLANRG